MPAGKSSRNIRSFEVLLLIPGGGMTHNTLKLAVEMRKVIEPGFKAYLRNAQPVFDQQLAGIANLYFIQEPGIGFICPGFEVFAESHNAHIGMAGHFREGRALRIIVQDIAVNLVHPFAFRFYRIGRKAAAGKNIVGLGSRHDLKNGKQVNDLANARAVLG